MENMLCFEFFYDYDAMRWQSFQLHYSSVGPLLHVWFVNDQMAARVTEREKDNSHKLGRQASSSNSRSMH